MIGQSNHKIEVKACTLEDLFKGKFDPSDSDADFKALAIPSFQRQYTWGEKQIEPLLQNLFKYFDELKPDENNPLYYLGSIILYKAPRESQDQMDADQLDQSVEENKNPQTDYCFNIIDGQQRLTTMALITLLSGIISEGTADVALNYPNLQNLTFKTPESQSKVEHNLQWLSKHYKVPLPNDQNHQSKGDDFKNPFGKINLSKICITLVITNSADEAYKFFETQNTGGVRLGGVDIIKVHHLSVIKEASDNQEFARNWEAMPGLPLLVDRIMRGRLTSNILGRAYPGKNRSSGDIRNLIIKELADDCDNSDIAMNRDIGYQIALHNFTDTCYTVPTEQVYALRQPLNAGKNAVNYLCYFSKLHQKYLIPLVEKSHGMWHEIWKERTAKALENIKDPNLKAFYQFYNGTYWLDERGYMHAYYEAALLLFIAKFGDSKLAFASKKIYRVIFSLRFMKKSVTKIGVYNHISSYPVLDLIETSYTVDNLFTLLDSYNWKLVDGVITRKSPDNFASTLREVLGANASDKVNFQDFLDTHIINCHKSLKKE